MLELTGIYFTLTFPRAIFKLSQSVLSGNLTTHVRVFAVNLNVRGMFFGGFGQCSNITHSKSSTDTVESSTLGYYRLVAVNVVAKLCGSAHGHYLIATVSNMAGALCEYHY